MAASDVIGIKCALGADIASNSLTWQKIPIWAFSKFEPKTDRLIGWNPTDWASKKETISRRRIIKIINQCNFVHPLVSFFFFSSLRILCIVSMYLSFARYHASESARVCIQQSAKNCVRNINWIEIANRSHMRAFRLRPFSPLFIAAAIVDVFGFVCV